MANLPKSLDKDNKRTKYNSGDKFIERIDELQEKLLEDSKKIIVTHHREKMIFPNIIKSI